MLRFKNNKYFGFIAVAFLVLGNGSLAHAKGDEKVFWLGGLVGVEQPQDADSSGAFGGTLGVKLGHNFGIGAYYVTSKYTTKNSLADLRTTINSYLLEPAVYFGGEGAQLRIGARAGMTEAKTTGKLLGVSVSGSSSDPSAGAVVGLDIFLGPFSIGGEAAYINVFADDSYYYTQFLGSLKLWL